MKLDKCHKWYSLGISYFQEDNMTFASVYCISCEKRECLKISGRGVVGLKMPMLREKR